MDAPRPGRGSPGAATLCQLLVDRARASGSQPALSAWNGTGWDVTTWSSYRWEVVRAAAGLLALGLGQGECVAIVASNRREHLVADQAVVHASGLPVTLYSSLSADQLVYCVNDCGATIAVVEDRSQLARWWALRDRMPTLRAIVVMDAFSVVSSADGDLAADVPSEPTTSTATPDRPIPWQALIAGGVSHLEDDPRSVYRRWTLVRPSDPACLVYTSGTTGNPKGVVLTHASLLAEICALTAVPGLIPVPHTFVGYLPMAHIVERVFSLYLPMLTGGHVYFCPSPQRLFEFTRRVRPTLFFGVPRMWEKMVELARSHVRLFYDEDTRADFERAVEAGCSVQLGKEIGEDRADDRAILTKLDPGVLEPVRKALGLDACRSAIAGSAPTPPSVAYFATALGIAYNEGYGLSETSCVLSINPPDKVKIGSVGPALPGVELRIGDDGEIQSRGAIMTEGYWHLPEQTAALFTSDGWLRTGDLGSLDDDGYLTVQGRVKELIITSYGKNISPVPIEALIKANPLVKQSILVGEGKPFISALIVIEPAEAARYQADPTTPVEDDPGVKRAVREHIDTVNDQLSNPEQIKRFLLLSQEWTAESGELTPSLKLCRPLILERNSVAVEDLYTTSSN